ncbi:methyl-accepting chemotaxis protein [Azospirillum halopraeferens]|uniref:methyl-accepting chemotaxis protein n=1 Tax=Azospirillum halopraeferens TaxID=34010 RepID=UPI0003F76EC2|nr:methyl-accepting chemotaxis protein [Azospirillum halopraeferens]
MSAAAGDPRRRCTQLGVQLGALATTLIDEERVLEATDARKALLADFADFRAPLGLAMGHLRGFLSTGDPALRRAFDAAYGKAAAARRRIADSAPLLTATQAVVADTIARLAEELDGVVATLLAAEPPRRSVATAAGAAGEACARLSDRLTGALTAMLDRERTLPATPERKELLAQIVDVRGPVGIASSHLRDYLLDGDPAGRRLFARFHGRAAEAMARLEAMQPLMVAEQGTAFAEVRAAWTAYGPGARDAMAARDAADAAAATSGAGGAADRLTVAAGILAVAVPALAFALHGGAPAAAALCQLAGLAGLAVWYRLRRGRPLAAATAALDALAGGGEPPPGAVPGRLGWSVERLRLTVADLSGELSATVDEHRHQVVERRQAMLRLSDGFSTGMADAVAAVEADVRTLFDQVGAIRTLAAAIEAEAGAIDAASGTATANLSAITAAVHETSVTATEIRRQVDRSLAIQRTAAVSVEAAAGISRDLEESTGRIDAVVGMIEKVATEIQVLALNATIEAARAGEAGRGFSVVAGEVKTLATRTMQMTGDIRDLVAAVQGGSARTAAVVADFRRVVDEADAVTGVIGTATAQQADAAADIARATAGANDQVGGVVAAIRTFRTGVERSRAAAGLLEDLAAGLAGRARDLHDRSDRFVAGVRAS